MLPAEEDVALRGFREEMRNTRMPGKEEEEAVRAFREEMLRCIRRGAVGKMGAVMQLICFAQAKRNLAIATRQK